MRIHRSADEFRRLQARSPQPALFAAWAFQSPKESLLVFGAESLLEPHFERIEKAPRETSYRYQLAAFVDAVRRGESPLTSGADCIANMDAVDAIYRAAGLSPRPRLQHVG